VEKDIYVVIEKPIRMVALLVGNAVGVYLMVLVVEPDILADKRTLQLLQIIIMMEQMKVAKKDTLAVEVEWKIRDAPRFAKNATNFGEPRLKIVSSKCTTYWNVMRITKVFSIILISVMIQMLVITLTRKILMTKRIMP